MGLVAKHKTVIDGITYTTNTFAATQGLIVGAKLARLVDASAVGEALLAVDVENVESALANPALMLDLVLSAAKSVSPEEFVDTLKTLIVHVTADKVSIGDAVVPGSVFDHFDTHFAGRYDHLLDVVVWAARAGFIKP